MAWEFKEENSTTYEALPVGDYRVRIESVDKKVSKNGNDMLAIKFAVSGRKNYLFHNIVFLPDRPEITNRMLTSFYHSFPQIPMGEFDLNKWIGKVGAVHVKHEDYNGEPQARVHYFIDASKQNGLPAWVEPDRSEGGASVPQPQQATDGFIDVPEGVQEQLPF
jgi:hypothetical protein